MTRRFQDGLAKATHVASGAQEGIEVRIREETHDSNHRYRCVDASARDEGSHLFLIEVRKKAEIRRKRKE
jgi:hypothetical protein